MRKNVCVFVLLVVMVLCVNLPVEVQAATTETRMLQDLLKYITGREMMCTDILWATEYIDRFDRERSWENLQLARASVSYAALSIRNYKLPEHVMTAEDVRKLMKQKVDVSYLSDTDEFFKTVQTSMNTSCLLLRDALMSEVFLQESWSIWMRYVENLKKLMDYNFHYLAHMADEIITRLNSPAYAKTFNRTLERACPQTHARRMKKPATIDEIEASANVTMKKIEEAVMELTKIIGAMQNSLNATIDGLKEKPMKISNMPPLIYKPDWWNNSNYDINYFWNDSNGDHKLPDSRIQLTRVPDECFIRINGVSLAQVKDYQKRLEYLGLKCFNSKEEGKKFYLFYLLNRGRFALVWENNTVIINIDKYPVCFMPLSSLLIWKEAGLMK